MFNLYNSPVEYSKASLALLDAKLSKFNKMFFILNLITFIAVLFSSVLTSLMISKLIYSSYPDWFFYASAGSSAVAALMSSFLNFFVVRDTIKSTQKKINLIDKEMLLFNNKTIERYQGKHREFNLYVNVGTLMDSKPAKEEAGDE